MDSNLKNVFILESQFNKSYLSFNRLNRIKILIKITAYLCEFLNTPMNDGRMNDMNNKAIKPLLKYGV